MEREELLFTGEATRFWKLIPFSPHFWSRVSFRTFEPVQISSRKFYGGVGENILVSVKFRQSADAFWGLWWSSTQNRNMHIWRKSIFEILAQFEVKYLETDWRAKKSVEYLVSVINSGTSFENKFLAPMFFFAWKFGKKNFFVIFGRPYLELVLLHRAKIAIIL